MRSKDYLSQLPSARNAAEGDLGHNTLHKRKEEILLFIGKPSAWGIAEGWKSWLEVDRETTQRWPWKKVKALRLRMRCTNWISMVSCDIIIVVGARRQSFRGIHTTTTRRGSS
jgi:hypothetical protein